MVEAAVDLSGQGHQSLSAVSPCGENPGEVEIPSAEHRSHLRRYGVVLCQDRPDVEQGRLVAAKVSREVNRTFRSCLGVDRSETGERRCPTDHGNLQASSLIGLDQGLNRILERTRGLNDS